MAANTSPEELLLFVIVAENLLETLPRKERKHPEQWIASISKKVMIEENDDEEIVTLLEYACYLALSIAWGETTDTPFAKKPPDQLKRLDRKFMQSLYRRCRLNLPSIQQWAEDRSTKSKRSFISFTTLLHPWIAKPLLKNLTYGQSFT